jgi:hypothetical protein
MSFQSTLTGSSLHSFTVHKTVQSHILLLQKNIGAYYTLPNKSVSKNFNLDIFYFEIYNPLAELKICSKYVLKNLNMLLCMVDIFLIFNLGHLTNVLLSHELLMVIVTEVHNYRHVITQLS